jgi:hypothetical protein
VSAASCSTVARGCDGLSWCVVLAQVVCAPPSKVRYGRPASVSAVSACGLSILGSGSCCLWGCDNRLGYTGRCPGRRYLATRKTARSA